MQLRGSELHVGDGKLQVEGELFVFVLYDAGDENGTKQWMEYTLPVRGKRMWTDARRIWWRM